MNDQVSTESAAIWLNRFAPPAGTGAFTIDSVSILWPQNTGGSLVGKDINLVAYYDADADGDPSNAVRLGADDILTIDSLDTFIDYAVNLAARDQQEGDRGTGHLLRTTGGTVLLCSYRRASATAR